MSHSGRMLRQKFQPLVWQRHLGILFLFLYFIPLYARAEPDSSPDLAVQRVQEALSSRPYYPWYDIKSDNLARVDIGPDPAPSDSLMEQSWRQSIGIADSLVVMAWIALGVLLAALTTLLIMAFLRRETSAVSAGQVREVVPAMVLAERLESLPVEERSNLGDLLESVRTSYQQGDYTRATILLFSHQLVELDRTQRIILARGKTNRQYLREIERDQAANDPLVSLVVRTMTLFERTLFGHHRPSREEFEACWQRMEQFDGQL